MTVTLDGIFDEGTVSVNTGSTTLTFTGTFLLGGCVAFDTVEFAGASVRPKQILSDTQAKLAVPWSGANVVNQPFAWFFNAPSRMNGADTRQTIQDFALYAKRGGFRPGRTVTAAADPVDVSDLERTITYNRATAIAASIPQANTNNTFVDGWRVFVKNKGAGTVTFTPAGCTIDGAATFDVPSGSGAIIYSQGGNYEIYYLTGADMRGSNNLAELTNISSARSKLGLDSISMFAVRVAAQANVVIASALENGDTLDGIVLATGDLVLLPSQTAPAENGVYVVSASGAASRHSMLSTFNSLCGRYFSVCEGTAAERLYRCTSDKGGTLGATAVAIEEYKRGVRYDVVQSPTAAEQAQARQNIYAAPFDALAYNGMQHNGNVDVGQEFVIDSGAALVTGVAKYIADGWQCLYENAAAAVVGAQISLAGYGIPLSGYTNGLKLIATTAISSMANGNVASFTNKIEGYRAARLGWGTASAQPLSYGFRIYTTNAGTLTVRVSNAAGNRFYYVEHAVAAGTFNWLTGTIPGDTGGTWDSGNGTGLNFAIIVSGKEAFPAGTGAWTTQSSRASTNTGNLLSTNNSVAVVTGLIVLPGIELPSSTRAPFIMRPFDQELLLSQRYLETSYASGTALGANLVANGNGLGTNPSQTSRSLIYQALAAGTRSWGSLAFLVPKRATPSVNYWDYGGNASAFTVFDSSGGASTNNNTVDGFRSIDAGPFGLRGSNQAGGSFWYSAAMWKADARLT